MRQHAGWPEGSEEGALILTGLARFLAAHTPTRRELPTVVASPPASAAAKPSTKTDPGWFSWRQRVAETRLRQEIRLRVGGRGRCRGRARSA